MHPSSSPGLKYREKDMDIIIIVCRLLHHDDDLLLVAYYQLTIMCSIPTVFIQLM